MNLPAALQRLASPRRNAQGIQGTHGTHDAPARSRAGLIFAIVIVMWGVNWPVSKALLAHVSPWWSTAFRSTVGMITLFIICAATRRLVLPKRGDLPVILSVGLLHMTVFSLLVAISLQYVSAGRSAVLAYTTPLWVMPAARLWLGEALTPRRLVGIAFGLLGIAVMFNPLAFNWHDRNAVFGNALVLASAFVWAIAIVHMRAHRWVNGPFELSPWQLLLASVILCTLAAIFDGAPRIAGLAGFAGLMTYGGIVGGGIAYWLAGVVTRQLPAGVTSLGLLGVPVVGTLASALLLRESLGLDVWLALALIVGGIALGTVSKPAPAKPAATSCRTDTAA
ncbi:putative cystine transporter YijE [Pandoraea pneumonica]|uniref:Putative cystine transporter YijE n=1 Tax=Pandoraea pneumonica TaxID=2508299 RepID=A0A5E4Z1W5_9BURK|nr:DMT family transporter [Pandoraea pneumonica]VVE54682.1 putative cystine transporter YijE [Pandoraea pneumonica]